MREGLSLKGQAFDDGGVMVANGNRVLSAVLLLENGDRLTRAEFERRYTAIPQLKKAELIEGMEVGRRQGAKR